MTEFKPGDRVNLVTPQEAATALAVSTKTLTRWANDGTIQAFVTPGGHRRYNLDQLMAAMQANPTVTHLIPPEGNNFTPCCGTALTKLPLHDKVSNDPAAVTCTGGAE